MKKIMSAVLTIALVLSSVSALAAGVAPAAGTSPIEATAAVNNRTITVAFTSTPFDENDDVTFLLYAPESATSNNIIEENIIHADQIDYKEEGFSFAVRPEVEAGDYNLLIGGTDVEVPCLVKVAITEVEPEPTVVKGDLDGDANIAISDLTKLARLLAGFADVEAECEANASLKEAADVNQDADITVADLTKLARFLAGFTGVDLNDAQ